MELFEKTIKSEVKYEGRIITTRVDTVELPNGKIAKREVVEHPGGVGIAAITENNELLMVRQFRSGPQKVLLEIPAGKLERGEDPAACGLRELEEETGYTAKEFFKVSEAYATPGFAEELLHIYVAKDLVKTKTNPDEDEFLEIERVPLLELVEMVMNGEIRDSKTQICILKAHAILKRRGLI
jgi:ADP-ribose pyrophosphatase